jgi:uncharacterized protein (DUF1810 family)
LRTDDQLPFAAAWNNDLRRGVERAAWLDLLTRRVGGDDHLPFEEQYCTANQSA